MSSWVLRLVMYERDVFLGICQDCSFLNRISAARQSDMEDYYRKQEFPVKEEYRKANEQMEREETPLCTGVGIPAGHRGDGQRPAKCFLCLSRITASSASGS
jgi:hypothetical protein